MNIDRLEKDEVLGCVAGDDTVLVVTPTNETAADIADKLREML